MRSVAMRLLVAAFISAATGPALFATEAVVNQQTTSNFRARVAVREIAKLIEVDFYDEQRAKRIARELRKAADLGVYDSYKDPRELAAILSHHLEFEDRHFQVSWSPGANAKRPDTQAESRSVNHGFVEARVLPGGVGYIKIDQFAHFETSNSPQQAAADAALNFVGQQPSLIIDLRDNGGGSPKMVGYLVQQFVHEPQKIANIFKSRRFPDSLEISPVGRTNPPRTETPLYILVSGRTGSSAEAFAYTLQAAGRAQVIGEETGGAANPGSFQRTASGLDIFISFGTPINPITGTNWEKVGITPDVKVPQEQALNWAHLQALERNAPQNNSQPGRVLETLKAASVRLTGYVPSGVAGTYGDFGIIEREGQLHLQYGRRPERQLVALGNDMYALAEDPAARYRIERTPNGSPEALVRILDGNREARYRKNPTGTAKID